jgi:hypothetical protein
MCREAINAYRILVVKLQGTKETTWEIVGINGSILL